MRLWGGLGRFGLLVGLLLPMQSWASTVRGTVTLPSGAGLPDVVVTIIQVGGEQGPWTGKTGASGGFSISDPLIFGNLSVSVSRPNTLFVPKLREFFDDGASTITADFSAFTNSPINATSFQISRAGLSLESSANPLGFPTSAFFEYGIGPTLDHQSPPVTLSGNTPQSTRFSVLPVPPAGSVIRARLVATNALGRSEGPVQEFEVPFQQFTARFTTPEIERPREPSLETLWAADFNRDNRMDFAWFSGSSVNTNLPYNASGPDTWTNVNFCLNCWGVSVLSALVLDYDRDNKPDLLVGEFFGDFQILQQNASGDRFSKFFAVPIIVAEMKRERTIDFDRDGRDDLITQGFWFYVLKQQADGSFETAFLDSHYQNLSVALGDLNGDGFPDVVFSGTADDGQPSLFKLMWDANTGLPNIDPSLQMEHLNGVQKMPIGLSLADLDGNGSLDIISLARIDNDRLRLEIYWNDGAGNFGDRHVNEVRSSSIFPPSTPFLTSGDFDNDGLEDVLLSGDPCILISAPRRAVQIVSKPELSPQVAEAICFDADGDGRLDLLLMGRTPEGLLSAQVMKNNIAVQNHAPAAPVNLRALPGVKGVRFDWDAGLGDDLTPTPALTWNLRVGTYPGGSDIVSPLSDLSTGRRYVLQPGNAGLSRFFDLHVPNLETNLFWSVQAVDAGYLGGAWAPEQVLRSSSGEPFRLTEVLFGADGSVRVRGKGDGLGAILNWSEDLIHWTPVAPFEMDGEGFQAVDPSSQASRGRYYSAR